MINKEAGSTNLHTDEITLAELVQKLREFSIELLRNWLIVLLFTLPLVAFLGYKAWVRPITYTAKLTFMLNEDKGGSAITSLLGQFGGLLGASGEYQLGKIIELSKSRRIITASIFDTVEIEGQKDLIANHIIRIQNLHDRWKKDKLLNGFFFTRSAIEQFSVQENKALIALHAEFVGGEGVDLPMLRSKVDDETGIMTLRITARNEMLAIYVLNRLYEELSGFYIFKSTERESETLAILAQKRDSLRQALYSNDYSSAHFDDQSYGLMMQKDRIPSKRYQRNNQILSAVYAEAIKNAELAEFALKSTTPFLSLIDVPIAPIEHDPRGRGKAIAIGLVLGGIFASVFIIMRKLLRGAVNQ